MRNICIIGATGTIGTIMIERLLLTDIDKLVLFSRDETKQNKMKYKYKDKRIKWVVGDIRDYNSINNALNDIDICLHFAALKHVSTGQEYPMETVKTNIIGTQNVIDACKNNYIDKLVYMSTDKAVEPTNVYGMTKYISERMVLNEKDLKTYIVRSGNILSSRGSVIPFFKKLKEEGKTVPLTDINMKRWFISKEDISDFILHIIDHGFDKWIHLPEMREMKIIDIIKRLECDYEIIGKQDGEKLEESLYWDYEKDYKMIILYAGKKHYYVKGIK